MIRSLGESWSECGGGLGEKLGGVEGAGVCVYHSSMLGGEHLWYRGGCKEGSQ